MRVRKNNLALALAVAVALSNIGVAHAQIAKSELKEGVSSKYVVKRGDTLWSIAGGFLKSPLAWPRLWGMNRTTIRNPNLIYPGDVLLLVERDGKVFLSKAKALGEATENLSPRVRIESGDSEPINAIPGEAIAPFIDGALIVKDASSISAPRIEVAEEGHLYLGAGSIAYTSDIEHPEGHRFGIYRAGVSVRDPGSGEVVGVELDFAGVAVVAKRGSEGSPSVLKIASSTKEVIVGDMLLTLPPEIPSVLKVKVGPKQVSGRVVLVHGHLNESASSEGKFVQEVEGGPMSVVILNKGLEDGLEVGQVFGLSTQPKEVVSRNTLGFRNGQRVNASAILVPSEENGLAMVFRVFDRASYAIILTGTKPVRSGDAFASP